MTELTHFDENGKAIMVDITHKTQTYREAMVSGKIHVSIEVIQSILQGTVEKGDVLGVARVSGIMATKRTADLIPMCHPLMITGSSIEFEVNEASCYIEVTCIVKVSGPTGVEMEAMTGATVALLTIYDMCKAIDKNMVIDEVKLMSKSGGKSGDYRRHHE